MALADLPADWSVWDQVDGDRLILVFRPDIFDGSQFPPACLPTIYVREGEQDLRHAGPAPAAGTEGRWMVTLILEPEVSARIGETKSYDSAKELAVETATDFVAGELDIEGMYQLPRTAYLSALRELIDG